MDRIPKGILSLIASAAAPIEPRVQLDKVFYGCYPETLPPQQNSLAPYAAVSRDWQLAFEPFTFHILVLSSSRIDEAERQGFLTQRRLRYVRTIVVSITFPLSSPSTMPFSGMDDDRAEDMSDLVEKRRDKLFTSTIKALFRMLKMAPEHKQPHIDLRLGLPVPMEYGSCITNEAECIEEDLVNPRYFAFGVGNDDLPELPMVASCHFDLVSWSLFIAPEAACVIVSKMPRLRKLEMHLSDMERQNPALRIKLREDFARSLSLVPQTVVDFEVYYARLIPRDHSYIPTSIISPNEQHDPLSQALFNFSQRENLTRFSAKGSFDLNMIGISEAALSASHGWPTLETYEIGLLAITPSGKWLATPSNIDAPNTDGRYREQWGPPSVEQRTRLATSNINEFRGPIDSDYAHSLLCAAGRAALYMPRLKMMRIHVGVAGEYSAHYEKGVDPCMGISGIGLDAPAEELLELWRRVSRNHDQQFSLELWSTCEVFS